MKTSPRTCRNLATLSSSSQLGKRSFSSDFNLPLSQRVCLRYTHTRLTALCPGLPKRAGTRKVKPIWILLKQEIVSGSGISWAICKSAPSSRQITMPAPHHSVFYRPDALPVAQPTASKHCTHVCLRYRSDFNKWQNLM